MSAFVYKRVKIIKRDISDKDIFRNTFQASDFQTIGEFTTLSEKAEELHKREKNAKYMNEKYNTTADQPRPISDEYVY